MVLAKMLFKMVRTAKWLGMFYISSWHFKAATFKIWSQKSILFGIYFAL